MTTRVRSSINEMAPKYNVFREMVKRAFVMPLLVLVVVVLLFYVHGKHLRSCRDGQLI